jgi:hypothetical protein
MFNMFLFLKRDLISSGGEDREWKREFPIREGVVGERRDVVMRFVWGFWLRNYWGWVCLDCGVRGTTNCFLKGHLKTTVCVVCCLWAIFRK